MLKLRLELVRKWAFASSPPGNNDYDNPYRVSFSTGKADWSLTDGWTAVKQALLHMPESHQCS